MNVCRYITGIENVYLSHIVMWGSITVNAPVYGMVLAVEAPSWDIELGYPSDMRRTRSHEIYVTSSSVHKFSYTKFTLSYLAKPNMRILGVEFR